MCGRFNYVISDGMVSLLDEFGVTVSGTTRYNLAPTESVPIIRQVSGLNQLLEARWWLVPSWSDGPSNQFAMFNTRAENLDTSRAFKEPFKHKRCLISATCISNPKYSFSKCLLEHRLQTLAEIFFLSF